MNQTSSSPSLPSQLRAVLASSRPVSWINTAFPFAAAFLISGGQINQLFLAGTFYFLLPYNLLMYGVNDIFDYESDLKNPRKGGVEGSIVAPNQRSILWIAIILINGAAAYWLGSLIPLNGRIALGVIIFLALSYSVKGLRFKEIPLLDSINSACHFVAPAVLGYMVSPAGIVNFLVVSAFMAWGMASHALGAIQDIIPDRAGNIRSIATQWGARLTARLVLWLYGLSVLLTALIGFPFGLPAAGLVASYALNAALFIKYTSDAQSNRFRRAWANFMWLNGVVGFWLTQYMLFIFDPFQLGPNRLDYILSFCIIFSFAQLVLISYNFTAFRRPKTKRLEEWPKISILIHAYNQADNIASTLLAVLGQNYPDYEILFTDLGSTDNTLKIAQSYSEKKLKILHIEPIKKGWTINSWAADQLLQKANGDYAVLVSADTVLMPNAIAQIAALMENNKLDVCSLLPADQNKSFAQKTILSHNQYLLLAAYPAAYLQAHSPERSTAHGGIIAFDIPKIRDLEGFKSVKASPLEDQELFHRARRHGLKSALYRASDLATSQNHTGWRAIVEDNIQRFYPALRFHFPLTIFLALAGAFVFSAPLLILFYDIVSGQNLHLVMAALALSCHFMTRLIIALEAKQNIFAQVLAPLTNLIVMMLLFVSLIHYELAKPRWKQRTEAV
ncbi:prenyltransferase [Candidatus Saccharibacteria bacterium]|nr:prenyltransferase [Candidatus Saccharibacteria bacterium]